MPTETEQAVKSCLDPGATALLDDKGGILENAKISLAIGDQLTKLIHRLRSGPRVQFKRFPIEVAYGGHPCGIHRIMQYQLGIVNGKEFCLAVNDAVFEVSTSH